jgi:hypothetical protein
MKKANRRNRLPNNPKALRAGKKTEKRILSPANALAIRAGRRAKETGGIIEEKFLHT